MGEAGGPYAPKIIELLKHRIGNVNLAAGVALGNMGEAGAPYAPQVIELLKDADEDTRRTAAWALGHMGPFGMDTILYVLNASYHQPAQYDRFIFWAHWLGGGKPDNETLIAWLGRPETSPRVPHHVDSKKSRYTLEVFKEAWELSGDLPELRTDLERQMANVVMAGDWATADLPLLQHYQAKILAGSEYEDIIKNAVEKVKGK